MVYFMRRAGRDGVLYEEVGRGGALYEEGRKGWCTL